MAFWLKRRVNENMEKGEISFKVVNGKIPKIEARRQSRYEQVIKGLMENPNKVIQVWGASASGLRNAIKRKFPNGESAKFIVAERKRRLFAMYKPN
jgi:hypothetical protein